MRKNQMPLRDCTNNSCPQTTGQGSAGTVKDRKVLFTSEDASCPPATDFFSYGTSALKTQPSYVGNNGNAPSLITFFQLQVAICSNQTLSPCGKWEAPMQKSKVRQSYGQLWPPQWPCCVPGPFSPSSIVLFNTSTTSGLGNLHSSLISATPRLRK